MFFRKHVRLFLKTRTCFFEVILTLPMKYISYVQRRYTSSGIDVYLLTMPKFTSQILLLFSKVLHILENLLLKNFTGLKVVS